jgi:hypothetical protein
MEPAHSFQHERHLKRLENAIREICDHHKQIQDHLRESWSKTMHLFVIAEDLRGIGRDLEKMSEES